jgi:hypothetical protein
VGVWVDHKYARLVSLDPAGTPPCITIQSAVERRHRTFGQGGVSPPGHVGGNAESHYQRRREEELNRYYDLVIAALSPAVGFVIMGPGEAKRELWSRIQLTPRYAERVLDVLTTSRITDREIAIRAQDVINQRREQ